ncbi:hypothetical protein [Nesterenkonia flava]|uniref:Uncharacterized protein n=1 Tax=Nesterenkonia flava TaxID=469799 RepID=A0ABU1FVH5_9MICC|nr:hypothetical protein [Nesterenkonia flava]MDR5712188.1 hypothetical protein [Nesterenkonia flava]
MLESLLAAPVIATNNTGLLSGVGIIGLILIIVAIVMVWRSSLGTVPKVLLTILAIIFPVVGSIIAIVIAATRKA